MNPLTQHLNNLPSELVNALQTEFQKLHQQYFWESGNRLNLTVAVSPKQFCVLCSQRHWRLYGHQYN